MAKKDLDTKTDEPQAAGFSIVVNSVRESMNRKTGQAQAQALVSVGPAEIGYSKLAVPRVIQDKDKFVAVYRLTAEQRKLVIDTLAPVGVKIAAVKGFNLTDKEVATILRSKMAEYEDEEGNGTGVFKMGIDQKMAFADKETGELSPINISIVDIDNNPMTNVYLANGSEGMINFMMDCTRNKDSGKAQFPFRLKAVKLTKYVPYEKGEGPAFDDFSSISAGY